MMVAKKACGDEHTSGYRSAAIVTIPLSVKAAEIIRWARALHVDQTLLHTHVYGIHVGLLAFGADVLKLSEHVVNVVLLKFIPGFQGSKTPSYSC